MKILIDVSHPAHVHLFRNLAKDMISKGNDVLFTAREKDVTIDLLEHYRLNYKTLGGSYSTILGKIIGMVRFDFKLFIICLHFKPDLLLSHGSIYAAHVSFLIRKPHIALEDTGNKEQLWLYKIFTKVILTPSSFHLNLGRKQIRYDSFHELAYLHSGYFHPDKNVLKKAGIRADEPYILIRFTSWKASHDKFNKGLSLREKSDLIEKLNKVAKIYISAESDLPENFSPYLLKIPPEDMHHLMFFAKLYIGEGATMASESAMMGVPAIYINSSFAGTIKKQAESGMLYWFRNYKGVADLALEIVRNEDNLAIREIKRMDILKNSIDLTKYLISFIENHQGKLHAYDSECNAK